MKKTYAIAAKRLSIQIKPGRFIFLETPSAAEYIKVMNKELASAYEVAGKVLLSEDKNDIDIFIDKNLSLVKGKKESILRAIDDPDKEKKTSKAQINLNLAENFVSIKFREQVTKSQEKLAEIKLAIDRTFFIEAKIGLIPDGKTMSAVSAVLEGLIGNEKDKTKWEEIYRNSIGWTPEECASLTPAKINEKFPSLVKSEEVDNEKNPEVTLRMNAMISRAESLYKQEEPEFVDQYKNYLLFTIHQLKAEKGEVQDIHFEGAAMSPEKYHKINFTNFSERPSEAMSGSQFVTDVMGLDMEAYRKDPRQLGKLKRDEIQNAILMQIELGNIPDALRQPKPINIPTADGGSITVYAMPDVISIGSNEDNIRVPMTPVLSQALARKYGLALPTKTIVENIWEEAGRTTADGKPKGRQYTGPNYSRDQRDSRYLDSAGFYVRQNDDINRQLEGVKPGTLVAGGKKELVVSTEAANDQKIDDPNKKGRISFYGLRDSNGKPIQMESGHGGGESGYKHTEYALGTRYCAQMVVIRDANGNERVTSMNEALMNPAIAKDLNRSEYQPDADKRPVRRTAPEGAFNPDDAYNPKKNKKFDTRGLVLPT